MTCRPGDLDGLPQPCLVFTHGLSSSRDRLPVLGGHHPGVLGVELLDKLLEALCRELDLLVYVCRIRSRPAASSQAVRAAGSG